MSVWKEGVNVRIRVEDRATLQAYADREGRTLGNVCEVLLTWALGKLEKAGSVHKLLQREVPISRKPRRG
jgi:hypothetical protein